MGDSKALNEQHGTATAKSNNKKTARGFSKVIGNGKEFRLYLIDDSESVNRESNAIRFASGNTIMKTKGTRSIRQGTSVNGNKSSAKCQALVALT